MAISVESRRAVTQRAGEVCEYCKSQLLYAIDPFSVEHVIPQSRGGSDDEENLALSCQGCNNHKFTATEASDPLSGQKVKLFHPRQQVWSDHFAWSDDFAFIVGISAIGRATVQRLRLNRDGVVNLRRILRSAGEHPRVE